VISYDCQEEKIMDDTKTFQSLREALESQKLDRFYRDDIYLNPGQTWAVLEGGTAFTVTRLTDGNYSSPELKTIR